MESDLHRHTQFFVARPTFSVLLLLVETHHLAFIEMALNRAASYFITTPIYYVNSKPHIGHLYSSLLADTIARWQRIKHRQEPRIIFSTGTDEHGLKVERAAINAQLTPIEFCNQVSGKAGKGSFLHRCSRNVRRLGTFRNMFDRFSIEYTNYIRTTEKNHIQAVRYVWQELLKQKLIYKGSYEGWYSVQDESFVSEDEVKIIVIEHESFWTTLDRQRSIGSNETERNRSTRRMDRREELHVQVAGIPSTHRTVDRRAETSLPQ